MMKLKSAISFLGLAFLISACNLAAYIGTTSTRTQKDTVNPEFQKILNGDQVPGFEFIRNEILAKDKTCTECHAWAQNYSATRNYIVPGNSEMSPLVKRLKNLGGDMPKNRPALSEEAVAVLKAWIDAGAFEEAVAKPAPGVSEPDQPQTGAWPQEPTFADISKLVLVTNCNACHNPESNSNARNWPFQNLKEILELQTEFGESVLVPGNLSSSALWTDIESGDMPPKKAIEAGRATALTQEQMDLVKRWIEQGARERL